MKGRESGMPEEAFWSSFFNAEATVEKLLGKPGVQGDLVEFGCGYGTFTLPAARRTTGAVTALDIEIGMVECLKNKVNKYRLNTIQVQLRDFVTNGTGLDFASQAHAMIFNLLHLEDPVDLLKEAYRILRTGGVLSVIHWRTDIPTPRGPSLDIRPTPEQCKAWMAEAGFSHITHIDLSECCRRVRD